MLARLESAIGRPDLIDQMVLIPSNKECHSDKYAPIKPIKLIVGYDGSPNSHTALDIAFCMAHQTHLASKTEVKVQAVYVLEDEIVSYSNYSSKSPEKSLELESIDSNLAELETTFKTMVLAQSRPEKADKILWQARNLAAEWQSYFKSHLRFGNLCTELQKVVELEAADALLLGCQSINHPLIERLDADCPVLGIPKCLD
ncbi:universal stress family protein [Cylindrospermopsis raciborskii CENA302]|uniref:Universal stress family protein n=1 Tax=Cylindrospermopsis raciborskii CENA302 TaxID=1170768 RepID=A0A9Q5WAG9_9CYAN|nr:universal stress protein [Cylindrospermopsis raciborskii]OPH10589.1 universal stress family protein [Cylindrospermopsis raciborskii CENA302]